MRVLAHIHTYNDSLFIDNLLEGLARQTRPVDAIVVIDNASTDATLDRVFPEGTQVIRNAVNTGSCGAVNIGLAHGQELGVDWTWVFDADSVPHPDALETLLAFFDRLDAADQDRVYYLASNMKSAPGVPQDQPMAFTESGVAFVEVDPVAEAVPIAFYKWSGALFRMKAVAKIGLPDADYFIDFGELEYGYRASQLGFRSYLVTNAIVDQDVGRPPGIMNHEVRVGPFTFRWYELSALRCYYRVRNLLYFWVYDCRPLRRGWAIRSIRSGMLYPRNFLFRPLSHHRQIVACVRGFWDGLTMHMERRY